MESGPTGDITAEFAPTPPSDSPVRPRAAAHSQPLRTLNHLISGLVHDFNVVLQIIQNTYGLLERVPEGALVDAVAGSARLSRLRNQADCSSELGDDVLVFVRSGCR